MGLKSREWFFGQCFKEVKKVSSLSHLANRALELGFGSENTQGHIYQACGSIQMFYRQYPSHRGTVRASEPFYPYSPTGQMLQDWLDFFAAKRGSYDRKKFGYNWDFLKTYLTTKYGGHTTGGGGGDNEFEIVIRLIANFPQ